MPKFTMDEQSRQALSVNYKVGVKHPVFNPNLYIACFAGYFARFDKNL